MMRAALVISIGVALISAIAAVAVYSSGAARAAALTEERDNLKRQLEAAQDELRALTAKREWETAQAKTESVEAPATPKFPAADAAAQVELPDADAQPVASAGRRAPTRPAAKTRERDAGGEETPEAEARERQQRRQAFFDAVRTRSMDYLQQNIDSSNDPSVQQRMADIAEDLDTLFDLERRARETESEDERNQIAQSIQQTREELLSLTRQQQDYMVKTLAEQYGITDPEKQAAFGEAVQELRRSPFFNMDPFQYGPAMGAMGGFGGGGGRWRDGGRRGGGFGGVPGGGRAGN